MGKDGLGEFEFAVLLACLRLGPEAHAVSIVDEILEQTGRRVTRAAVYVTLQRLEKKGLVSTRLGDPVPRRGGRPRRLVFVETAGVDAVREMRDNLRTLWQGLGPVLDGGQP